MNNTFDFKRFRNYLVYDLNAAKNNAGLTLAINGAMPVFTYFIVQVFSLIIKGEPMHFEPWTKIPAYIMAFLIVTLIFPSRQYGSVTDKRIGSDWLMIPASRLEKWISMLLITCVAVPAFLLAELVATDGLLSLIFNGTYGTTAISSIASGLNSMWGELRTNAGGIAICWPYALYLNWCEGILFFTLGAIFFNKIKIGKTFLTGFIITMVLSWSSIAVLNILGISDWNITASDFTEAGFIRVMNISVYTIYLLVFAALDLGLYLRIKSLKH